MKWLKFKSGSIFNLDNVVGIRSYTVQRCNTFDYIIDILLNITDKAISNVLIISTTNEHYDNSYRLNILYDFLENNQTILDISEWL